MSDKLNKELAEAIQKEFAGFGFSEAENFADELSDYVDSGDIFKHLSKESLAEILSLVKTKKDESDGRNVIVEE